MYSGAAEGKRERGRPWTVRKDGSGDCDKISQGDEVEARSEGKGGKSDEE
jgi:hypothetical protein